MQQTRGKYTTSLGRRRTSVDATMACARTQLLLALTLLGLLGVSAALDNGLVQTPCALPISRCRLMPPRRGQSAAAGCNCAGLSAAASYPGAISFSQGWAGPPGRSSGVPPASRTPRTACPTSSSARRPMPWSAAASATQGAPASANSQQMAALFSQSRPKFSDMTARPAGTISSGSMTAGS